MKTVLNVIGCLAPFFVGAAVLSVLAWVLF